MKAVKYLGCNLNDKGDPAQEVAKRIQDCMTTLNKLHIFVYDSANSLARKVQVYNAVIRAKLMYGLETIVLNTKVADKLYAFQMKGLQITTRNAELLIESNQ